MTNCLNISLSSSCCESIDFLITLAKKQNNFREITNIQIIGSNWLKSIFSNTKLKLNEYCISLLKHMILQLKKSIEERQYQSEISFKDICYTGTLTIKNFQKELSVSQFELELRRRNAPLYLIAREIDHKKLPNYMKMKKISSDEYCNSAQYELIFVVSSCQEYYQSQLKYYETNQEMNILNLDESATLIISNDKKICKTLDSLEKDLNSFNISGSSQYQKITLVNSEFVSIKNQ